MIKKTFTAEKVANFLTNLIGTGTATAIIYCFYLLITN